MTARRIAFFGQPGTGTTTVVTNVAAALAEAGQRVAIVGCGSDGRDTSTLRQGKEVTPLLDNLRQSPQVGLGQVAAVGFKGILCLELGKIAQEIEAAVALGVVNELLTQRARLDFVLYDATGPTGDPQDIVAPLLHNRQIDRLVAVSTAEADGLRAVNGLMKLLHAANQDGKVVELAGIIGNKITAPYTEAIIDSFARAVAIPVLAFIPQSLVITRSAFFGASVIDAAPLAHHGYLFRTAAKHLTILQSSKGVTPRLLTEDSFTEWVLDWGERLYDLGEGYVGSGGGI